MDDADWRVLDAGVEAWFDAPSMSAGAALVRQVAGSSAATGLPDVDLRPGGVRVRLPAADADLARSISAAARGLGLTADPAALQTVRLVFDTPQPASLASFWRAVLGYEPAGAGRIEDPSRRDPALSFRDAPLRPLRDRNHLDVVRAPEAVEATRAAVGQEPFGPYGVALADADGNEVDLVPGDSLTAETADWQTLFAAVTYYPVDAPARAADLASAVAGLVDAAGLPLLVDLRPDGVTIDSGKDLWDADGFVDLAAGVQAAARSLGLTADPTRLRFVQLGIDAVDVSAVRAFWTSVLGYLHDPRTGLLDIYDPRRLNPVVIFQPMDGSDTERRRQRNRIHVELVVPRDQAAARVDAGLAAGGRVVDGNPLTLVDPEGNELDLIAL